MFFVKCLPSQMTWYFNNDGVADGPHDEAALRDLIKEGRITAQTLVWQPGTGSDLWQTVETLAPAWWVPKAEPVSAPAAVKRGPETRGLVPMAPVNSGKDEQESGGFLAKLFGWRKKK